MFNKFMMIICVSVLHTVALANSEAALDKKVAFSTLGKVLTQSIHNINDRTMSDSLAKLRNRFSIKGWRSLQRSLRKSGVPELIYTHKLQETVRIVGPVNVSQSSSEQNVWYITVPINIEYQSAAMRITQEAADIYVLREDANVPAHILVDNYQIDTSSSHHIDKSLAREKLCPLNLAKA